MAHRYQLPRGPQLRSIKTAIDDPVELTATVTNMQISDDNRLHSEPNKKPNTLFTGGW
ncbi:unnamed protein product [Fusarium graminearum]|uniref:Chromosome 1, complete genome n=1 Tax=Gibberella zeae (strain ATCC MYA-4620 / CBS 123657 / FGSC 9075 / NRRL 31084 / PH-1) TaxID=229533 RepID=A0A098DBP4_GIBZE|nr:unnamed protein product [Fusarium graminearum]CZS78682.1 unnamed protein product [Fusarium graminearum]